MALNIEHVLGDITTFAADAMTSSYSNVTSASVPFIEQWTAGVSEDEVVRSFPYIQTSPIMARAYLVVMGLMIVTGVIGNIFIIGAYRVNKNLRTAGNEFTVNLALADLCVTGVADPMCIIGVTHGKEFFAKRQHFCQLVACLCLTACFCAFLSLGTLTLNRYVYICHHQSYHKLFRRTTIILMCVFVWIAAFLLEMPNFVGWGGHFFDHKSMQCIWNRTASISYTFVVTLILIGGPLLLMTLAYFRIFLKIKDSKKKLMAHGSGQLNQAQMKKKELKETLRSAKSIFIVVIAFLIFWTPYVVVLIADMNDRFPIWIHLWATLFAHMHSSVNCFIYGFTNPHFLQGYRKFLCLDVCFGDQPYLVGFGTTSDSDKGGPTSNMKSGVNNKVFPSSVTTKTSILPPVNT